jgi:hypothetical protein
MTELAAYFLLATVTTGMAAALTMVADGRPYRLSGREIIAVAVAVLLMTALLWISLPEKH